MACINHPGVEAQSYCQNCGKALCTTCVRATAAGQVFCDPCMTATGGDPSRAYWQAAAQNFAVPPGGGPNPATAAILGIIPGVGAMYNGQLFKGLIHVVIFAVLVSIADKHGVFGIFIGAWVIYQSFEAFQTAKAKREGLPLPDPFGLNELGGWLNLGGAGRGAGHAAGHAAGGTTGASGYAGPVAAAPTDGATPPAPGSAAYGTAYSAPFTGTGATDYSQAGYGQPGFPFGGPSGSRSGAPSGSPSGSPSGTPSGFPAGGAAGSAGGYPAATYPAGYSAEYPQQPFSDPYAGPMPGATADPYGNVYTPAPGVYPEYSVGQVGFIPPMPPLPPLPFGKRRKEPIWAFVLIGMGLIFLLNTMGFVGHAIRFMWPMMMIAGGVWLMLNRVGRAKGGTK